jgi:hypothetical protein
MAGLTEQLSREAARLSDEELVCELQCAERCALLATRTRRELALLRARCLRHELEARTGRIRAIPVGASRRSARP